MGYIYIIRNAVNEQVYIGNTEYTVEIRFKRHLEAAKHGNSKLYINMREIGIHNFYVETLENCDDRLLDEREKYWISRYDSFNNGYNSTTGGSSGNKVDIHKVKQMILDGKTKDEISKELGIRKESLCVIHDFSATPNYNEQTNKKKAIDLYSKDYKFIRTFNSVADAYNEFNNAKLCNNKANFYSRVKQSCEIDCIAFGYRWRKQGELYNKIKQCTIKKYCKSCGKLINGNEYCLDCYNKNRGANKLSKQQLLDVLEQNNFDCNIIGEMYGVTAQTVRKWCRNVGISLSTDNYSGVTCIELNMYFNTFKEAAEYMSNHKYTDRTNIKRMGYEIAQAKKFGYSAFGFT